MTAERLVIRPKTQEELNQQVYNVSSALGTDIVQPSTTESIHNLSAEDLTTRFPVRWKYYTDI